MIPPEEVAALAELYDRFAHALDPFSAERDEAEQAFYLKLDHLHGAYASRVNYQEFKREAVRQCKLYLRKN